MPKQMLVMNAYINGGGGSKRLNEKVALNA